MSRVNGLAVGPAPTQHAHQQGHQEDIVRLTTLLDTVNQGGSGQWPVTDSFSTTDDHLSRIFV